jgi:hypothetical protein
MPVYPAVSEMLDGDAARARPDSPIHRRRHLMDDGSAGSQGDMDRPAPGIFSLVYGQHFVYHGRTLSSPYLGLHLYIRSRRHKGFGCAPSLLPLYSPTSALCCPSAHLPLPVRPPFAGKHGRRRVRRGSLRPTSSRRFSDGSGPSGSSCWRPRETQRRAGSTGTPGWLFSSQQTSSAKPHVLCDRAFMLRP